VNKIGLAPFQLQLARSEFCCVISAAYSTISSSTTETSTIDTSTTIEVTTVTDSYTTWQEVTEEPTTVGSRKSTSTTKTSAASEISTGLMLLTRHHTLNTTPYQKVNHF